MRACSLLFAALLGAAPALAADNPRGHQHGAASLQVSLEGRALRIAFEGPTDNLLGFEHAPKTDSEKKTAARAEQVLKQSAPLFAPSPAAECQAQPGSVEMKFPSPGSRETHSEVEAEWRWDCAGPQALAHIDVGLFKAFPRLKELRVQIVTAQGQKTAALKPTAARLKIGP